MTALLAAGSYQDCVVIGAENEVYANSAEWVAANLEFV